MPRFKQEPLARHAALAPLSRDHYRGLVLARHLIEAAGEDAAARRKAIAEFVDGWDQEISEHFDDEERLLPGVLHQNDAQRLRDEHQHLRSLADQARELRKRTAPGAAQLRQIGETLEAHIRWEERELFTRVQEGLSDEQRTELQRQTTAIEARRPRQACRTTRHSGNPDAGSVPDSIR